MNASGDPVGAPTPCLTALEVEKLRSATPGEAPAPLAAHVAACSRCQESLLAVESLRGARDVPIAPPSLGRTVLILLLLVAGGFAALYSIRWVIGY